MFNFLLDINLCSQLKVLRKYICIRSEPINVYARRTSSGHILASGPKKTNRCKSLSLYMLGDTIHREKNPFQA